MPPYSPRTGFALALTTAALMGTELLLTRMLSVIIWYHFAFLAISVALFGTGVAAMAIHARQYRLAPERTSELLAAFGLALAVAIVVVDLVLLNATPNWFAMGAFTSVTLRLAAVFALSATPFFFGGAAVSLAMTRYPGDVHRLYFWDLAGAASGCLSTVPLLAWLGAPAALLICSFLAVAAAVLLVPILTGGAKKFVSGASAVMLLGLSVIGGLSSSGGWLEIRVAKGVNLQVIRPEFNRWNSFSMVTVLPDTGFRGWGLSPAYAGPIPEQKTLVIDMNAMTTLTRFGGSFDDVRHAYFDLSALVYRVRPTPDDVCVIGAGGGKDVLAALVAGGKHVTAVEINPLIVEDVVKGRYRDFTGDLYRRKDVSVVVEDGRSFIRRSGGRYDVVLLSMVDTSAATAAGAYAMTENGLYTSDAFVDFMSKLRPAGILSVSTVSLPGLMVGARLASVSRAGLGTMGRDPSRSVAVFQYPWLAQRGAILNDYLIRPDGFSDREIETLKTESERLGFVPAYLPGRSLPARTPEQGIIQTILNTKDASRLDQSMNAWPLDVSAVNDARPFFFYMNRLHDLGPAFFGKSDPGHLFGNGLSILSKVAAVALVMVCLFLFLPVLVVRRRLREGQGAVAWDLAYVACLGIGFMFLELSLIQRFLLYLGNPTYALVVVLFVLLLFGSIGSRLFTRLFPAVSARSRLLVILGAIVLYALVLDAGIGVISRATWSWVPAARAMLTAAFVAPLGLLLGMPFPTGLSVIAQRAETRIPWLWSVNSATSVLGSVAATLTSLHAGIPVTLLGGALLYGCAAMLWVRVSA